MTPGTPFISGVVLGAGLIIAIGAQNALVLRHGLRRQHVGVVTTICVVVDLLLILLGVAGFGSLIALWPKLTVVAAWGGVAFLSWYGLRAALAAIRPGSLNAGSQQPEPALKHTVIATLAVSLLNPHVYLDTVILIGSIAAQYDDAPRRLFGAGAAFASFVWFYSLGFGARMLAPLFAKPIAWRLLDMLIAAAMWSIAISLIRSQLA
ncbi:MAG: LysE/ArgO family amino acid transporter [Alphaproteobacteria bacterium]